MSDTASSPKESTSANAATPKKSPKSGGSEKTKVRRQASSHPKVADMVTAAITTLKERGGSSLQAIKKYIASNYKVDVEKLSPYIKRYLRTGVEKGVLVQTKGKGAMGSFKLSASASRKTQEKPKKPKKKEAVSKKPKKPKKSAVEKKVKKPVKTKAPKPKVKTPKKSKPASKSPTKPKTPKVKKSAKSATKKATPKKTGKK